MKGGLFGDYECNIYSTRVLENRRNANEIYNFNLFKVSGGYNAVFNSVLIGGFTYGIGYLCKKENQLMKNPSMKLFGYSILATIGSYYLFKSILTDRKEREYLINNKEYLITKIEERLLEDYKMRNKVYPSIEAYENNQNKSDSIEEIQNEVTEETDE